MKISTWNAGVCLAGLCALATAGCGADEAAMAGANGVPGVPPAAAIPGGATTPTTAGAPAPAVGAPVGGPQQVPGPVAAPSGQTGVPCEVHSVTEGNCQGCHGATPSFGAPMPLVTMADYMAPAPSDATKTVADVVKVRINQADPIGKMPPVSMPALSSGDLATFNGWLDGGMQPGQTCAPSAPAGGDVGGGTMGTTIPPEATECFEMLAHAPGALDQPYSVGIARDAYFNFTFNAPWTGTKYGVGFYNVIDNASVLHHWLLYKDIAPHANDGGIGPSSGTHPTGELIHGWAPGGEELELGSLAAIEMPQTGFTLELHYNSSDPGARDASGARVCVTDQMPQNLAAVSWLGTDAISNTTTATGVCTPASTERIRILGGTPHMHVAGRSMKVEILGPANNVERVLLDEPFDFDYQRSYDFQDEEIWLEPGQRVRTTCNYSNPVSFGEGTGDEMCYFFTLHYPAYALTAPGLGAIIHGPNQCGVL